MNYWLICLPRADLQHCINVGTFGLQRKHIMGNVRKGDRVLCCAGKGDWKIIASGAATSNYYFDDTKLFLKAGVFPDRFDFQSSALTTEKDLLSIIDQLTFVTNLAYWSVFFRNGIVKISKEDWQLATG